jgi:hypothetical protein
MNHAIKPVRRSEYWLKSLDDDLLLYDPCGDKILPLNPTASLIWEMCDGGRTVKDMIDLLVDVDPQNAAHVSTDVETVLKQFVDFECIRPA